MQGILSNVKDPAWWFSAVVIAILASIFAGFAKDYLERKFGLFWAWTRTRRATAKNERLALIEAWSSSEGRMAVALLHLIYWVVVTLGVSIVMIFFSAYFRLRYGGEVEALQTLPKSQAFGMIVGIFAMFDLWFRSITMIGRANEAMTVFREKNGLPKFGPRFY